MRCLIPRSSRQSWPLAVLTLLLGSTGCGGSDAQVPEEMRLERLELTPVGAKLEYPEIELLAEWSNLDDEATWRDWDFSAAAHRPARFFDRPVLRIQRKEGVELHVPVGLTMRGKGLLSLETVARKGSPRPTAVLVSGERELAAETVSVDPRSDERGLIYHFATERGESHQIDEVLLRFPAAPDPIVLCSLDLSEELHRRGLRESAFGGYGSIEVDGDARRVTCLSQASAMRTAIDVKDSAHHLTFSYAQPELVRTPGQSLQLLTTIETVDGHKETTIWPFEKSDEASATWHEARIALGEWTGSQVTATLSLVSADGEGLCVVSQPHVTGPIRSADRPNILLIVDDQHSGRALGVAGNANIKTPRLDRLASEGAYFSQAYCNDPICGPSRYSMMSGRYPTEIGAFQNMTRPRPETEYLAEYLRDRGYFTGTSGKTHFAPTDAEHGFEDTYHHSFYNIAGYSHYTPWYEREFARRGLEGDPYHWKQTDGWVNRLDPASGICTINPHPRDLSPEHWITQKALRLIEKAKAKQEPFFVHASYFAPHHPYGPLKEFYDLYEGVDIPLPPNFVDRSASTTWDFTEDEWKLIRRHYYAFVSQVDFFIGELLDGLEDLGVAENTLVIMVSDHGDMMGEWGVLTKGRPEEASIGVPFFVRWPRRFAGGKVIDAPVSLIDVLPTVFDALGERAPWGSRGESVLPLIDGTQDPLEREVYALDVRRDPFLMLVAREHRWKLTCEPRGGDKPHIYRLYDVREDPWELTNRFMDPSVLEHRQRMVRKLKVFWERESAFISFPLPEPVKDTAHKQRLPIKD